jgi:DNA-binding XRE family transcriptional regulator
MMKNAQRRRLLRELRETLGLSSQEQLAQRLGETWSTVNRWENAKGSPSPPRPGEAGSGPDRGGMTDRIGELGR